MHINLRPQCPYFLRIEKGTLYVTRCVQLRIMKHNSFEILKLDNGFTLGIRLSAEFVEI